MSPIMDRRGAVKHLFYMAEFERNNGPLWEWAARISESFQPFVSVSHWGLIRR